MVTGAAVIDVIGGVYLCIAAIGRAYTSSTCVTGTDQAIFTTICAVCTTIDCSKLHFFIAAIGGAVPNDAFAVAAYFAVRAAVIAFAAVIQVGSGISHDAVTRGIADAVPRMADLAAFANVSAASAVVDVRLHVRALGSIAITAHNVAFGTRAFTCSTDLFRLTSDAVCAAVERVVGLAPAHVCAVFRNMIIFFAARRDADPIFAVAFVPAIELGAVI